jgi:hypothetical protein
MNLETTVIGAPLLTKRDAHECLKSCSLISLTPAFVAISTGVQEDKVKEVAAHESLHFIWFEKWKQIYPKTKREEFDSPYLIWQYSEMVTDAILNTPVINKTINVKERSYDSFYELTNDGKSVMEELSKIFLTNNKIEKKIQLGYEYILSVFHKQNKKR